MPRSLLMAVLVLAVAAAGCSSSDSTGSAAPTTATTAPTPDVPSSTTSSTTTSTTAPTTSTTAPPTHAECVAELPDSLKLGQLLMPLVVESELAQLEALAAFGAVGGAALLGTPGPGLADALARVQAAADPLPLLIASDEEGGTVQRLGALLGALPSAATVGATLAPADARALATSYGEGMAAVGVDMVLAPVVDVGAGPGIGTRSYSDSAQVVTDYAGAVAEGYLDAGLIPVLKHFPGHGRASGDSHETLPTTPPIDQLRADDLAPYVELLTIDGVAVMVGHLDVPGLTAGEPASLSAAAVDELLRGELGFDGLVLTDSIEMGALGAFSATAATRRAIGAGADVVIVASPAAVGPLVESLLADIDAGLLSWDMANNSVARVLDAKGIDGCALSQAQQ